MKKKLPNVVNAKALTKRPKRTMGSLPIIIYAILPKMSTQKYKIFPLSTKDKVLAKMPEAATLTAKEKLQDRWTSLLKVVHSLSF